MIDHAGAVERLTGFCDDAGFKDWSLYDPIFDVREVLSALSASEARLRVALEALGQADLALRDYACCGLGQECIRSPSECRNECGRAAGLALDNIAQALATIEDKPDDH